MVFICELGGIIFVEKLCSLVLDIQFMGDEVINDKVEVLMFYVVCVQLVEIVIKFVLVCGQWVIGDCYDLLMQVYQGGGWGIDCMMLVMLCDVVFGDFCFNLMLYFDVMLEVGLQCVWVCGELDCIEQEFMNFFNCICVCYFELVVVDFFICMVDVIQLLDVVVCDICVMIVQWMVE